MVAVVTNTNRKSEAGYHLCRLITGKDRNDLPKIAASTCYVNPVRAMNTTEHRN